MKTEKCFAHPMVIFWLGALTGALVVGFAFTYGAIKGRELQNYTLQTLYTRPAVFQLPTANLRVNPAMIGSGDGSGY